MNGAPGTRQRQRPIPGSFPFDFAQGQDDGEKTNNDKSNCGYRRLVAGGFAEVVALVLASG
jgi:hypothetical protein